MKQLITILFLFVCFSVHALDSLNYVLYKHAELAPAELHNDIDELISFLIKPTKSEKEIAEILAYWIALNIEYDVDALQANNMTKKSTLEILNSKKALCVGYSDLYFEFCKKANIKCYIIAGYAKGFDYSSDAGFSHTNHAWNIIEVDSTYYLMDITWASGGTLQIDGKLKFMKKIMPSNLFANPMVFIQSHLPAQPRWQLLHYPVSMKSFREQETHKEMVDSTANYFNFNDSIIYYQNMTFYERKIKDIEDSYHFYPGDLELASNYESIAYEIAKGPYDDYALRFSINCYKKARSIYLQEKTKDLKKAFNCGKGIDYVRYRLIYKK